MRNRGAIGRQALLRGFLVAATVSLSGLAVFAQSQGGVPKESAQMRFIVPFPAGGTLDILARTVANELGPVLGEGMIVENRAGASGAIGADFVARAPKDGRTLLIASNTLVTLPAMRKDMPFDVFNDLAPVIKLGETPTVLTVHPSFAATDYKSFVDKVKTLKEGASYNSPGIASPPHLAGELLSRATGLTLVHVPYRGTQPAVSDLVSGQILVMMAPLNAVLPFFETKQLIPIALTDATRTKYLPDTPTLTEIGVKNMPPVTSWFAVLTTGGTPPERIQRLNTEIAKILRDPKVEASLTSQTFEIKAGTPEDLGKLMRDDAAINAKIVAEAHISAQ
ncbi:MULTISPECIES: tripartite tricarboxylate transporter substrate-binding protein [unclassified Beijerinckia]|uniref:Bug family tripartite tricarboxylate transporter substrate binding protein n=1 Tax=unclassified Beijerinckia TaxID=2638183 RepID=UPI000898B3B6|nr:MULTISPECIES: tripartite tricarboxylate transporter substrate-binding protein [unclassified Beijerinckia]MDH7797832.1 tripartite-type tricarboxylate transporter receptor subunit TctC [Beijerinckia sp. GAS462]SED00075.1 Tripartite-type tricarboxylate transporter, receptor component TctC [Beijerinckia sp. 28-YEA-48]